MSLKTYDVKLSVMTFGPLILSGFGSDGSVTFEPTDEIWKIKKSIDGLTTRSRTNNDDYKATVKLVQTSKSHTDLLNITFRNSALSGITYPFKYACPTTGETYESAQAFVLKDPTAEFGMEASDREYEIYLPACKRSLGEVLTSALGFLG